jgi:hypothetical protein
MALYIDGYKLSSNSALSITISPVGGAKKKGQQAHFFFFFFFFPRCHFLASFPSFPIGYYHSLARMGFVELFICLCSTHTFKRKK